MIVATTHAPQIVSSTHVVRGTMLITTDLCWRNTDMLLFRLVRILSKMRYSTVLRSRTPRWNVDPGRRMEVIRVADNEAKVGYIIFEWSEMQQAVGLGYLLAVRRTMS